MSTLVSDAPGDPLQTWNLISATLDKLTPIIAAEFPDFELKPDELLFASDGSFCSDDIVELAKTTTVKIELLQKSLVVRQGEMVGAVLIFEWDSKRPGKITMKIDQSVARQSWVVDQSVKIYGFTGVALWLVAWQYLLSEQRGKGSIPKAAITFTAMGMAIIPTIILGFLINWIFKTFWMPSKRLSESDSLIAKLTDLVTESTRDDAGVSPWSVSLKEPKEPSPARALRHGGPRRAVGSLRTPLRKKKDEGNTQT